MNRIIPVIALTVFAAQASSFSIASISNTAKKIKEKSSLEFYLESYNKSDKNTLDLVDVKQDYTGYYSFKLSKNTKLKVSANFKSSVKTLTKNKTDFASTSLRYYHSNILTEKKNGVSLSAQIRLYKNSSKYANTLYHTDGTINPRVYIGKTFSNKLSGYVGIQYSKYLSNKTSTGETYSNYQAVSPSLSYQISDKFSISSDLSFERLETRDNTVAYMALNASPTIGYDIAKGFSASFYYGVDLLDLRKDAGKRTSSDNFKNGSLGLDIYYRAF